ISRSNDTRNRTRLTGPRPGGSNRAGGPATEGETIAMAEGHDPLERRLSREDLLRVAAAVGGAGLLAGRTGIADAARTQLLKESGRLKVLDWAGYENDGGQPMFAAYVKAHPKNKPQFSYMTNEADALAKIRAGLK